VTAGRALGPRSERIEAERRSISAVRARPDVGPIVFGFGMGFGNVRSGYANLVAHHADLTVLADQFSQDHRHT
jgi:hypothetical protein